MCCVHVVPLFGYEQMKTSDERNKREAHLLMVSMLEIESNGIGGNERDILEVFLESLTMLDGVMVSLRV